MPPAGAPLLDEVGELQAAVARMEGELAGLRFQLESARSDTRYDEVQTEAQHLQRVLHDLRQGALPSRFEKAQQPDPQTLQMGLRTLRGMVWLELSWQADAPRLVQVKPPERQGSGSTLAQQLQHSLRQLALVELHQAGFERVVEFRFAARPGEVVQRTLVLELMGRHSNMLLLDAQRQIIALGRQVRDHQSRVRPIGTGDLYTPPPSLQGQPPERHESYERWRERLTLLPLSLKKALQQTYQGISPPLVRQLAGSNLHRPVQELDRPPWEGLHQRWMLWLNCLNGERFSLQFLNQTEYQVWGDNPSDSNQLALQLGDWYQKCLNQRALDRLTGDVRQRLSRWREKETQCLDEQEMRLSSTSNCHELQREADALLCLQNPEREQIDRAQKLYQKARKMRRSVAVLQERIQHHKQRLTLIEGSESFIDDLYGAGWENAAARINALQDLRNECGDLLSPTAGRRERKRKEASTGQPQPLELISPGGLRLQVGRNHRQNDWISLRQACSGDLWFHAQECPGSHVVLKASSGLAEDADLQIAADLAAHFSRAKGNIRVPVVMVPTDQLQRIAGAGPGTVRHRGGEIRWGEPDRAKAQLASGRLLA